MRRNCNLELRLQPSSFSALDYLPSTNSGCGGSGSGSGSHHHHHHREHEHMVVGSWSGTPRQEQQQQLTIFYNGQICVCDVTELQARSIIMLANRETEERTRTTPTGIEPVSPALQSQLHTPTGLSMKRSLQRFLQKRRHRVQATSPYHR